MGRLAPNKAIEDALSALLVTRAHHDPDATLEVVGRPDVASYGLALHRFTDELGLGHVVTFTGARSDAEVGDSLARADVYVATSRHEGFGVPVLEAMASGVPVVANEAAALPEVVGDAGLLVDAADPYALADAVARVVGDASLRERLAQAAAGRLARARPHVCGGSCRGHRAGPARLGQLTLDRGRPQAPTARRTRETKRCVDAARSKVWACARPSAVSTRRSSESPSTCPTAAAKGTGVLSGSTSPAPLDGLGHGGDSVGDNGDPVSHGFSQRDAEAFVIRGAHEHVGRTVVGLELGTRHRARQECGIDQAELLDEGSERRLVGLAERRATMCNRA